MRVAHGDRRDLRAREGFFEIGIDDTAFNLCGDERWSGRRRSW
jgi:hypothetical protein